MGHKFDPAKKERLHAPERYQILPPEETLLKLGLKEGQVFADIGCGTGFFTIPAAKIVGSRGKVYALDIAPEMLEAAGQRLKDCRQILGPEEPGPMNNVIFKLSEENKLPLENGSVDVVFLALVLHELEDYQKFFREAKRVLKPGGRAVMVEWKKEAMEMGPPVEERLSPMETAGILKANGFEPVETVDIGVAHYGVIGKVKEG